MNPAAPLDTVFAGPHNGCTYERAHVHPEPLDTVFAGTRQRKRTTSPHPPRGPLLLRWRLDGLRLHLSRRTHRAGAGRGTAGCPVAEVRPDRSRSNGR